MEESSNFKDYLIFFIQIVEDQIKNSQTTYHLTDENSDSIIIDSARNFVKLFKAVDKDNNGIINEEEFVSLLYNMNIFGDQLKQKQKRKKRSACRFNKG